MLVGRGAETGRLEALLEGLHRGESAALVLLGEAGIGKSALLDEAERLARDLSMVVLRARGVESESELAFCALADLLRPLLDELSALPLSQASALKSALTLGPPVPGDAFAVGMATLGLLAKGAEARPLVALVDDVHWLDSPSLSALAFAARRLEAEGVLVLFAARVGEGNLHALDGFEIIDVGALDEAAAHQVMEEARPAMSSEVSRRVMEAAAGNPLALLEIPAALTEAQRAGVDPLEDPLEAGPSMTRFYGLRLARLSDAARACLLVAAASDRDEISSFAPAAAALGLDLIALDEAEDAQLVAFGGGCIRWRHPLVRSAVYHGASSSTRRSVHRALADLAGADGEPDRHAWHLAAAAVGSDESAASALETSANNARLRRGNAAAARAFERAARLSLDPEDKARRLYEAALDLLSTSQSDRAGQLLHEAIALTTDALRRADIEHTLAMAEMFRGTPHLIIERIEREAKRVMPFDPGRAAVMLADACLAATMTGDVNYTLELSTQAIETARCAGPQSLAMAEAMLANALILAGRSPEADEHLRSSREVFERDGIPPAPFSLQLVQTLGHSAIWVEDNDWVRDFLTQVVSTVREQGAARFLAFPLACMSELAYRRGRWAEAYALATESEQIARDVDERNEMSFSLVCRARVEAGIGSAEDCRAHVAEALSICRELASGSIEVYAFSTLGLLEMGIGSPEAALVHLEPLTRMAERWGLGEANVVQWASDSIEAQIRAGNYDSARSALSTLESQGAATGRYWSLGESARCRGLLAAESEFEEHFAEALRWHTTGGATFEQARTLLCLGERRRRSRQPAAAREPLSSALGIFEQLGARPWAMRATDELRASGAQVAPVLDQPIQQLTPQELQVALAVGSGMTNRETAKALFLSPKTVDYHLGKVYRKLGIRSRSKLAALMERQIRRRGEFVPDGPTDH